MILDKSQGSDEWMVVGKNSLIKGPDPKRMKFEEAMNEKGAIAKLQMKEQQQQIVHKLVGREAKDHAVLPIKPAKNSSSMKTHFVDKERELSHLIQSGLIVPRWGNMPEVSLDSQSPGLLYDHQNV